MSIVKAFIYPRNLYAEDVSFIESTRLSNVKSGNCLYFPASLWIGVHRGVAHCDDVSVYAEDEGRESLPETGGFQFPSWLSKDDFITVTVALSISYGIRWHVSSTIVAHLLTPLAEHLNTQHLASEDRVTHVSSCQTSLAIRCHLRRPTVFQGFCHGLPILKSTHDPGLTSDVNLQKALLSTH